mgnify:CR=1 FL=1
MPYVNGLLMAILRPALTPVQVGTRYPADLVARLPYLVARNAPGGEAVDPRFDTVRAVVQADAYAATASASHDLASDAMDALVAAWRDARVYDQGHLARVEVLSLPAELAFPDAPSGLVRFTASYLLTVRP